MASIVTIGAPDFVSDMGRSRGIGGGLLIRMARETSFYSGNPHYIVGRRVVHMIFTSLVAGGAGDSDNLF